MGVLVGVSVGVSVGVFVGVGNQLTFAPPSTELLGEMAAARFTLSCRSTYEIAWEPWGSIDQAEPEDVERR